MSKKGKQRILALSTAICLLLSLSGCVGGTQPDADKDGETGTSSTGGTYYDTAEYTEEQLTAVREDLQDSSRMEGLGEVTKMEFYENGVRTGATEMNQQRDNKILYYSGDICHHETVVENIYYSQIRIYGSKMIISYLRLGAGSHRQKR